MSVPSTASTNVSVCLHCTPGRTVWRKTDSDLVEKVYVTGSTSEAEHELAMGRAAMGPGVVEYVGSDTEPASARPTVTTRALNGDNLENLVATRGAIAAAEALELLQPVAETLARLHALRTAALPQGMFHGDVKPQNLLATDAGTVLLDFEHARAVGSKGEHLFTGGTSAYSPPEAHEGRPANPGFDVFGWGATLAFLLDGGTVRLLPRHPRIDQLVLACCATEPGERPTAAQLAEQVRQLLPVLRDDSNEAHLHDWATGSCSAQPSSADDPRAMVWWRRRRLLQRMPRLLEAPAESATEPDQLQLELDHCARVLARFPRNPNALRRRQQLLRAVAATLTAAAERERAFGREERFDDARRWLRTTETLVSSALAMPGGLTTITTPAAGVLPTPMHRTPIEFLRLLTERVENCERALQEHNEQVSAAERELDLDTAEACIDAIATEYGGTSPTVAARRDQLHRLTFYLDRIARAEPNVQRVGPLWDAAALRPLQDLVSAAEQALHSRTRRDASGKQNGAVGLRSLQLTLDSVQEEFPHLERIPPAHAALAEALQHLTDQAWQQLSTAEERLHIVPVPVRPLQLALGRLDTFRMLEALVDRPERPRSELLDGLERLRLGLEQARAVRDRLAENAEHALARGHWTTGLFEMERAVAGLNPTDDAERIEAERLQERLQAARRTKNEVESAVRRNVDLNATYTKLEDDPNSTFEQRLQALQDRRDCLMFLGLHVQSERAELYRQDLRTVETQIALERAAEAERRLDASREPLQRLRIARETVEQLGADDSSTPDNEPPGRKVRLLEHWRTVLRQCQAAVDEANRREQQHQRQRRRMLAIAIVAAIATTTALGFALRPLLFGEPAHANEKGR